METGIRMQEGCGIQRIPCVCLQTWTWLQRERAERTSHVAPTAAQQVKSAGGIPPALVLKDMLVIEAKT